MKKCQVERGILIRRKCSKPAVASCSSCRRLICKEHTSQYAELVLEQKINLEKLSAQTVDGEAILCIECASKVQKEEPGNSPVEKEVYYRRYYDSHYGPIVYYHSGHYHDHDTGFDSDYDDDSTAGGFFDS